MAEVYWIHLSEHTDVFSEGYVGFTSKTAEKRFAQHCVDTPKQSGCRHLYSAIETYGDALIVDTLCICTNDYGLWLEQQIRPHPYIGWNIATGGKAPMLGKKSSEKTIEQQKKTWKQNFTEARRENLRKAARKGAETWTEARRKAASEAQIKIRDDRVDYKNHCSSPEKWVHAQEFYQAYIRGVRPKTLEKALHSTSKSFNPMFKLFESGWVPCEDPQWLVFKMSNMFVYKPEQLLSIVNSLGTPKEQQQKHIDRRGTCAKQSV